MSVSNWIWVLAGLTSLVSMGIIALYIDTVRLRRKIKGMRLELKPFLFFHDHPTLSVDRLLYLVSLEEARGFDNMLEASGFPVLNGGSDPRALFISTKLENGGISVEPNPRRRPEVKTQEFVLVFPNLEQDLRVTMQPSQSTNGNGIH